MRRSFVPSTHPVVKYRRVHMHNALFFGEKSMQLPSLNSVMQILISISSLFVTSASQPRH